MLHILLMLLAQVPSAPCDTDGGLYGADCRFGGFRSHAALFYGSGAPDLVVGENDNLPDGGWGNGSKYGLIRTMESSNYTGWHPDLTVSSYNKRSAGLLFGVENSYWSPGFVTWATDWAGNTYQHGQLFVYGNGIGVKNLSSYVRIQGQSTVPDIVADVMLGPTSYHPDGWCMDVWNGPILTPLRIRCDGAIQISGVTYKMAEKSEGLQFYVQQSDGGYRTATIPWTGP